jgi:hypothetical protein
VSTNKKNILIIVFTSLVYGCAPTPITFDTSTLAVIPKNVAIKYLNSVADTRRKKFPSTLESVKYEERTDYRVCLFNYDGKIKFYDPYSLLETSPYLRTNWVKVVSASPVINEEGGFVHIYSTKGREYSCSYLNNRDFTMKEAKKIFEALSSLGIKVN